MKPGADGKLELDTDEHKKDLLALNAVWKRWYPPETVMPDSEYSYTNWTRVIPSDENSAWTNPHWQDQTGQQRSTTVLQKQGMPLGYSLVLKSTYLASQTNKRKKQKDRFQFFKTSWREMATTRNTLETKPSARRHLPVSSKV